MRAVIGGKGNGGLSDGSFNGSFDGVAINGVVDATASLRLEERPAGDSVKGRWTTTLSGV